MKLMRTNLFLPQKTRLPPIVLLPLANHKGELLETHRSLVLLPLSSHKGELPDTHHSSVKGQDRHHQRSM